MIPQSFLQMVITSIINIFILSDYTVLLLVFLTIRLVSSLTFHSLHSYLLNCGHKDWTQHPHSSDRVSCTGDSYLVFDHFCLYPQGLYNFCFPELHISGSSLPEFLNQNLDFLTSWASFCVVLVITPSSDSKHAITCC